MAARVLPLETKLLNATHGGEVNAMMFALKNAAPADWRDVKTTQHLHAVATLTDAQLYAIAAGDAAADAGTIDGEYERVSPHADVR